MSADVKVTMPANLWMSLRAIMEWEAHAIDDNQLQKTLETIGYRNFDKISLKEQVKFIAEQIARMIQ
jgi:hypothetical protein